MISILKGNTIKIFYVFFFLFSLTFIIPFLPLQNPLDISLEQRFMAPDLHHFFGTDELGRDLLSRTLFGAATTIKVSIFALFSSLVIGVVMGGIAGYLYQTWVDSLFNWVVSLIFSLPFLLVMVSFLSLMTPNIFNAYLILTCIMWVNPARIVRAEVIRTRKLPHVTAFRAFGASEAHVLFYAVLPGCIKSALIFSLSYFPEIIGLEAGLSFLGLGVQPPDPGLGKMIFDGLNYIYSSWWLSFIPAAFLGLIVLVVNRFLKI